MSYRLQEHPTKQVPDTEEDEDHDGDDQGDQPDHRQEAWIVVLIVHSIEARPAASGRNRSATK